MLVVGAIVGAAALVLLALAGRRLLRAADLALEDREDGPGRGAGGSEAGSGQGPAGGAAPGGPGGGPDPAP